MHVLSSRVAQTILSSRLRYASKSKALDGVPRRANYIFVPSVLVLFATLLTQLEQEVYWYWERAINSDTKQIEIGLWIILCLPSLCDRILFLLFAAGPPEIPVTMDGGRI